MELGSDFAVLLSDISATVELGRCKLIPWKEPMGRIFFPVVRLLKLEDPGRKIRDFKYERLNEMGCRRKNMGKEVMHELMIAVFSSMALRNI